MRAEGLTFGADIPCPRCTYFKGKSERTLAVRKSVSVSRYIAVMQGYTIVWSPPGSHPYDAVSVKCPDCGGTGITKG